MKFNFRIDYVVIEHLLYGHRDVCIEADTEEEARKIVEQSNEDELVDDWDASELHIDDYEINDRYPVNVRRNN